jgi:hypothetical protein
MGEPYSVWVPRDFDPEFYLSTYPDVALSGMSPEEHYARHGAQEKRLPARPKELQEIPALVPNDFDPEFYLATYPDIARAGVDPFEHYVHQGIKEGRLPAPRLAGVYENWLWRGFGDEALPLLDKLLNGINPYEQLHARWVLARWHNAKRNWAGCLELLQPLRCGGAGGEGPDLLAIVTALSAGQPELAGRFLAEAMQRHELTPDLYLARMAVVLARGMGAVYASKELAGLFQSRGLASVRVTEGPAELFDRLEVGLVSGVVGPRQQEPTVSVILPSFNSESTLPTALRGLLAQSWKSLEILIVDDGSEDRTSAIAAQWAQRDNRIRLLAHGRNAGAYVARNTGLAAARGEFITVHDADDWSHPEKIARQAQDLLANPDRIAVFSHHVRLTPNLMPTRWRMEDTWIFRNMSSLMFRREAQERLGFWDRVKAGADTEFYERMVAAFGASAISDVLPGVPLSFVRMTPGSLSHRPEAPIESQLEGARRDYMLAARRWHRRLAAETHFFLPARQEIRPFIAPTEFAIDPQPEATDLRDVIACSPCFDPSWYIAVYPELRAPEIDAAAHYAEHGSTGQYDPGPTFSSSAYIHAIDCGGANPLHHREREAKSGGSCLPISFGGALELRPQDRAAMVFAHACRAQLFGAEQSLLYVLEDIRQGGLIPVVVLPHMENARYLEALRARAANVFVLPFQWRRAKRQEPAGTINALRNLIRHVRPAEVCVNSSVLRAPLLAAREEGVRTIMYVRELLSGDATLSDSLGDSGEAIRQEILKEADRFIAPSRAVAQWIDVPNRTDVIPNRVSEKLFQLAFAPQLPLRVGLIGNVVPKKGLADFLALAERLADRNDITLHIVGPVHDRAGLPTDLPPNVILAGYRPSPEEAIEAVDIVINLSTVEESFGRTILEAQAGGRPVVCYRRGALPEMVVDGETGFLVDSGDVDAVADALRLFADDTERLARISATARDNARRIQLSSRVLGPRVVRIRSGGVSAS